jgi:hypothetical protein
LKGMSGELSTSPWGDVNDMPPISG